MNVDILALLLISLEMPIFWHYNVDEECEKFSNSKSSALVLSICLISCQFQPGVAYKSIDIIYNVL